MARRVFLHIGAPKSGTTYLQDRLSRSRDTLLAQSLDYLETRSGDHFHAALDLIQRPWAGELKRARGQWDALADSGRRSSGDVLVSHEILAAARPEQVARAFDSFGEAEFHVVLTVRDLGRQIPAEWQESVKHRSLTKFETFMGKVIVQPRIAPSWWFWRVQSVPDVLARWSNGLTPEQVHVVTVPPSGAPPELLWERFISVLGLDPGAQYAQNAEANASLGIADVAVLRRLNRRLKHAGVSRATYVELVRELLAKEVFAEHEETETAVVPEEHRAFVGEVTEEWLDWIIGSRVDVVGDVEDLRPRWPEIAHRHPDHPQSSRMTTSAIEALAAVLIAQDRTAAGEDLATQAKRLTRRLRGS